jgi:hypothetical protein
MSAHLDGIKPNRFAPGRSAESGSRAEPKQNAARIVSVIAFASIAAGAINVAAAATIARGSAQNLAFFWAIGVAQLVWGAVTLVRAPQWWLALGALGNAVVVATWVVSRTVGLPFGDLAGVVLPVGFPDDLATIFEAVTAVGATGWPFERVGSVSGPRSGFALAAAVLIGALGFAGVLSRPTRPRPAAAVVTRSRALAHSGRCSHRISTSVVPSRSEKTIPATPAARGVRRLARRATSG